MQPQSNEIEHEALTVVAHEMGGPLQLLSLHLGALRSQLADRMELRRVTSMGHAVEALRVLAHDLLDADQICQGRFQMSFAEHELCALTREVVESFRDTCVARRLVMSFSASTDNIRVYCDYIRLTQALNNVIGNAVKFSPSDAAVLVRIGIFGDEVGFSVTDAGPGIPPEYRHLVFEPRWQIPGERRGHGLGLFVARRIVEAHHGRIWVEDADQEGTTIAFRIPFTCR